MNLFSWMVKNWKTRSEDVWDQMQIELERSQHEAKAYRSLALGTHRDTLTGMLESMEQLDLVEDPIKRARLQGEEVTYRRIETAMQIRARTLNIRLQRGPDHNEFGI